MSTQRKHNIQITCSYTKSMKIQTKHKPPSSPYLYSPNYLPLWQQSTKKEGDLVLSWRRRGLQAGSGGKLSGGVIGVVVRPVVVDRRGLCSTGVVGAAEVAGVAVATGSVTTVESVGGADVTGVRSG